MIPNPKWNAMTISAFIQIIQCDPELCALFTRQSDETMAPSHPISQKPQKVDGILGSGESLATGHRAKFYETPWTRMTCT